MKEGSKICVFDSHLGIQPCNSGTTLKVLPAGGTPSEFAVEEAQSVDAFFTAGAGRKCQSLSIGGHVLILGNSAGQWQTCRLFLKHASA